jgi:hypothetical protein
MFKAIKYLLNIIFSKEEPHTCTSYIKIDNLYWYNCPVCMNEMPLPMTPIVDRHFKNRKDDIIYVSSESEPNHFTCRRLRDGHIHFIDTPDSVLSKIVPDSLDLIELLDAYDVPLEIKVGVYYTKAGDMVFIDNVESNASNCDFIRCHGTFLTNRHSKKDSLTWKFDGSVMYAVDKDKGLELIARSAHNIEVVSF